MNDFKGKIMISYWIDMFGNLVGEVLLSWRYVLWILFFEFDFFEKLGVVSVLVSDFFD